MEAGELRVVFGQGARHASRADLGTERGRAGGHRSKGRPSTIGEW
jgi:hypothetical protein